MEYGNYQWCIYLGGGGAKNAPDTVALTGSVIKHGNLIVQQIYPEDSLTDELVLYVRKGFANGDTITWGKWFITNLYLEAEEILTRIIKGCDTSYNNLFNELIPSSTTSIIFTDITMPSSATLIDVDEDGDGGVVAWMDGTTMYVSTQKNGIKVEANKNSYSMFYECENLTTLDVSNFNTSNVTDMSNMFWNCNNLTTLDVSNFNTSNVTAMNNMFNGCCKLTTLDLSNFDTSNVTAMNSMFNGCSNLTTLDLSNFDTRKVIDMSHMFNDCSDLTALDLSNWDMSKIEAMEMMFQSCSNLTTLTLPNCSTAASNMMNMFSYCTNLTTLDLYNFCINDYAEMQEMFSNCTNLTSIKVGDKFKWTTSLSGLGLSGTWQDETGTQYIYMMVIVMICSHLM